MREQPTAGRFSAAKINPGACAAVSGVVRTRRQAVWCVWQRKMRLFKPDGEGEGIGGRRGKAARNGSKVGQVGNVWQRCVGRQQAREAGCV